MRLLGGRVWLKWWRLAGGLLVVLIATWLFLGSPCTLVSCSPSVSDDTLDVEGNLDDDNGREFCDNLNLIPAPVPGTLEDSSPQLGPDGPYNVLYNYSVAKLKFSINESVTYTTHSTLEFLHHVGEVATRWNGPISVAVFVPNVDFCIAISKIARLRVCGASAYKERVTWHLYWPKADAPPTKWNLTPDEDKIDCNVKEPNYFQSWRINHGYPYPVNVARNIARTAATTWFVLPSDVELYPSLNMSAQFIEFISNIGHRKDTRLANVWPRVYVVPVFEVASTVPNTKEELVRQYMAGDSVYFHRNICAHCQKFPGLTDWIQHRGIKGKIHAFSMVKRQSPYHRWEPIYISTKDEPFYDERLTWEGLQDKMSQMHELCLREYNFIILDRAFLVHSPGIKIRKPKITTTNEDAWREQFIANNSNTYNLIMDELAVKLGQNHKCKKH